MITIDTQAIVQTAGLITALGVILGAAAWCLKFVNRQKKQEKELAAIREEQTLICFGVRACLQGLREQGCNGPVTEALNRLDKHLNTAAHHGEEEWK